MPLRSEVVTGHFVNLLIKVENQTSRYLKMTETKKDAPEYI